VGCGDNFTFVITCKREKQIDTKAHKLFQEGYLENMRNTIKNIQDWRKTQALSDRKVAPIYPSKMSLTNPENFAIPQIDYALNRSSHVLSTHGSLKGFVPSTLYHYEKNNTLLKLESKGSPAKSPMISEVNKRIADIISSASPQGKGRYLPQLEVNISK